MTKQDKFNLAAIPVFFVIILLAFLAAFMGWV